MNAKNRQKATEARRKAELPDRFRAEPMPEHLGGGPLTSSTGQTEGRAEQREMAKQRKQAERRRKAKARRLAKIGSRYWITPKAERRHCSHCSAKRADAIRPKDQKAACAECIDRLGIKARRSSTTTATSSPKIHHVEPGAPFVWASESREVAERWSALADDLRDRAAAGEVEGMAEDEAVTNTVHERWSA